MVISAEVIEYSNLITSQVEKEIEKEPTPLTKIFKKSSELIKKLINEIKNRDKEILKIRKSFQNILDIIDQRHDYLIEFTFALIKMNENLSERINDLNIDQRRKSVITDLIKTNKELLMILKEKYFNHYTKSCNLFKDQQLKDFKTREYYVEKIRKSRYDVPIKMFEDIRKKWDKKILELENIGINDLFQELNKTFDKIKKIDNPIVKNIEEVIKKIKDSVEDDALNRLKNRIKLRYELIFEIPSEASTLLEINDDITFFVNELINIQKSQMRVEQILKPKTPKKPKLKFGSKEWKRDIIKRTEEKYNFKKEALKSREELKKLEKKMQKELD